MTPNSFHKLRSALLAVLCSLALGLSSCDSFIYEDEGDCAPYYRVKFIYDMNMKYADAFAQEVNSVTLYLADPATGAIVWSKHESGDALRSAGYEMEVPVDPGRYTLIAWAGDGHRTHFAIPEVNVHTGLQCTMGRDHDEAGNAFVDHDLDRLYHGVLENQEFPSTQGIHYYTVPLMKNTNDVTVLLQHVSGTPVDPALFDFTITDDNGLMDWNNAVLPDETITYWAHETSSGTASFDPDPNAPAGRAPIVEYSAAIAEHTMARLMKSHENSTRLTIRNHATGEIVLSIPLVKYVLLVKGYHNRPIEDQEYLDRQDHYSLTFFLDEGNRWVRTHIYINSWKIVDLPPITL